MKSLLASDDLNDSAKTQLCFALAKASNDQNKLDEFFEYLNRGNKLRKEFLDFSYEESEVNFNPFIKDIFNKNLPTIENLSYKFSKIKPIFIVGMPRSGTTLVEQIISSHSKVFGGGEIKNLTEFLIPLLQKRINDVSYSFSKNEIFNVGQKYLEKLNSLDATENIITDKWPLNFRHIGFIMTAFPEAKIIHVKRNSIATCWSIYKHYFADNGNGWAYNFEDLTKFYDAYLDLMKYWHGLYPGKIYDLCYEELTINQEEETSRLLKYCDLEWDKNCLNFHNNKRAVETASSSQVRKKMYQGSSNEWMRYKDYLSSLSKHFENK